MIKVYGDYGNQCYWFHHNGEWHSVPWYRHPHTFQSIYGLECKLCDITGSSLGYVHCNDHGEEN